MFSMSDDRDRRSCLEMFSSEARISGRTRKQITELLLMSSPGRKKARKKMRASFRASWSLLRQVSEVPFVGHEPGLTRQTAGS
jgi:hypothetical protein